jgi:LuxR family quorum sensing-dependent transcriptional regulator
MVADPVFSFAEAAQNATDMSIVDAELSNVLARFGIDHFVLYQAIDRGGRPTGARMCGRRHDEWRKHYEDGSMVVRDDLLRSGRQSLGPTTWSRFRSEGNVSAGQQQIFDEATDFGLYDGFYLPIHQPDGSMHGVSMMVRHKLDNEPRTLAALHLLAIYYSIAAKRLGLNEPEPADASKHLLTPRQRECLQWSRAGKSSWEIGQILSLSEHTVNEHLAEARKRLNVRTTTQAVIEAIAKGLIGL